MQRIKKAYAENGDLKIIPDTPPLDGSENWEQGRGAYYELDNDPNTGDPLALDIDREQDNYFKNVISKNIKHWQENTYPIYFKDVEYLKNATVRYTDGNVYVSKIDNNKALPTDTDNWVNFEGFGTININALPDKPTPDDTDNFAIQETGGLLKKLSWSNLKANLFDGAMSLTTNGYIRFPSVMGGFMFQWGTVTSGEGIPMTVSFPVTFPTACFGVAPSLNIDWGALGQEAVSAYNVTTINFTLKAAIGGSTFPVFYFAIGH